MDFRKLLLLIYSLLIVTVGILVFNLTFNMQEKKEASQPIKSIAPMMAQQIYDEIASGNPHPLELISKCNINLAASNFEVTQILFYQNDKVVFDLNNSTQKFLANPSKRFLNYDFLKNYLKKANPIFVDYKKNEIIAVIPILKNSLLKNERVVFFIKYQVISNIALLIIISIILMLSIIPFLFLYLNYKREVKKDLDKISSFTTHNYDAKNQKDFFENLKEPFKDFYMEIVYLIRKNKNLMEEINLAKSVNEIRSKISGEGFLTIDRKGNITSVNKKLLTLLDYEDEHQILNRPISDFVFDEKSLTSLQSQLQHSSEESRFNIKLQKRDGNSKKVAVAISSLFDKDETLLEYLLTINSIDIEQTINVAEISETNPLSADYLNPLIAIDNDNFVIAVNKSFTKMVNTSKHDLISREIHNALHHHKEITAILSVQNQLTNKFEIFEPFLNKWFYITENTQFVEDQSVRIYSFIDISSFKSIEKFHDLLLNDMQGFVFFTDENNQLLYLSPSFSSISKQDQIWFEEYLNKVFIKLYLKDEQLITNEIIMIFLDREPRKFNIIQTKLKNEMKLYICTIAP